MYKSKPMNTETLTLLEEELIFLWNYPKLLHWNRFDIIATEIECSCNDLFITWERNHWNRNYLWLDVADCIKALEEKLLRMICKWSPKCYCIWYSLSFASDNSHSYRNRQYSRFLLPIRCFLKKVLLFMTNTAIGLH